MKVVYCVILLAVLVLVPVLLERLLKGGKRRSFPDIVWILFKSLVALALGYFLYRWTGRSGYPHFLYLLAAYGVTIGFLYSLENAVSRFYGRLAGKREKARAENPAPDHERRTVAYALITIVFFSFMMETVVFNFRSLAVRGEKRTFTVSDFQRLSGFSQDNGILKKTDDEEGSFVIEDVNVPVTDVEVVDRTPSDTYKVKIAVEDQSNSGQFRSFPVYTVNSDVERSRYLSVVSEGKVRNLSVTISGDGANPAIFQVNVNTAPPFAFCLPRFLFLLAFCAAVYLIAHYRLYLRCVRFDSGGQNALSAVILVLCLASLLFTFKNTSDTDILLPYNQQTIAGSPYYQQVEAFRNGRLDLLLDNDELASVSNPYDGTVRGDVPSAQWDRAYYNGKFYCYFGIAPVLIAMLPVALLTGQLLNTSFLVFLFCCGFLLALAYLYRLVVRIWLPRANFVLYYAGLFVICLVTNALMLVGRAEFYEVAVSSALLFVTLMMIFTIRGIRAEKISYLILGGLFLVLAVGSRVSYGIYFLVLLPVILKFLFGGKFRSKKIWCAAAFALPVALGAAGLLWFNYARFGSPLNFGSSFQLTVSDTHFNKAFNLYNIIPTIYHYFLQPPSFDMNFPFLTYSQVGYTPVRYYYYEHGMGVLNYPVLWFALLAPFYYHVHRKQQETVKRYFLYLLLLTAVANAFLIFGLGGVVVRYYADFLFVLTLVSVITCLDVEKIMTTADQKALYCGVSLAMMGISVLMVLLLSLTGDGGNFQYDNAQGYMRLMTMVQFWR